ncbi:NrtR DNA-binding winged helix domain-containing protein [Flavobacterium algicola]|uniref:NrtR DNA-binding winged helix domain-containing protein n=1 Tax=Flavobacterium algicola TaxID=556529 RepID=UPI001EFDB818|nr:NUDIX hydrolase [Flavobacterium algicola]MCG9791733.1 NUDIX hydrolase [Flavobacterium algicola]
MDFRKINNLSVDCVIFGLGPDNLNVLLQKRSLNLYNENYPVIDDWIIPGENVFKSNSLGQSADKILKDISEDHFTNKKQFRTYGSHKRVKSDKDLLWVRSQGAEARTITVVYYLTMPQDHIELVEGSDLQWFPVESLPEVGFDHHLIINDSFEDLKNKITTEPVLFDLVPVKFTLNELQTAFQILLNIELDNRNFRKKTLSKPYIVPLDDKRKVAGSKKPSKLYMFSKDVYDKIAEKDFMIGTILVFLLKLFI